MAEGSPVADLAASLKAGKPQFMGWCGLPEPAVAEILAREGFDCAMLDMQHGSIDFACAVSGIAYVASAGKPTLVRIPVGEFSMVSRLLDAGAAGVIAPMINSVGDARRFASFAKLPPTGERSWGPARALGLTGMDMASYLAKANGFHLAIAMIETREALDSLDGILGVAGIDGVLVGPSDLSIALSKGKSVAAESPDVDHALDLIAARCKARGKYAAAFCHSGRRAAELVKKGYQLVSAASDQIMLKNAAKAELAAAKG